MARMNWFDEETKHTVIDEQVEKLASFADAMADGIIERQELDRQERSLVQHPRQRYRAPSWRRMLRTWQMSEVSALANLMN